MGLFNFGKKDGQDSNFALDMVVNMLGGADGIKKKVLTSIFPMLQEWLTKHLDSVQLRSYESQSAIIVFKNKQTGKLDYTLATFSHDGEIERQIESANLENKLVDFLDKVSVA